MPISAQEWRARTGVNNAGRVCRPVSSSASSGKWEGVTVGRGVCVPGPLLYKACTLVLLMLLLLAGISDHEPGGQINIAESSSVPGLESEVCVSVLCVVPVLCMAYSLVVRMLLLLSGDVERNPGPTMIFSSNWPKVYEILSPVAAKWRLLGPQLELTCATLNTVQADNTGHPFQVELCIQRILRLWEQKSEIEQITFEKLASALCVIGERDVASKLCKYAGIENVTFSNSSTLFGMMEIDPILAAGNQDHFLFLCHMMYEARKAKSLARVDQKLTLRAKDMTPDDFKVVAFFLSHSKATWKEVCLCDGLTDEKLSVFCEEFRECRGNDMVIEKLFLDCRGVNLAELHKLEDIPMFPNLSVVAYVIYEECEILKVKNISEILVPFTKVWPLPPNSTVPNDLPAAVITSLNDNTNLKKFSCCVAAPSTEIAVEEMLSSNKSLISLELSILGFLPYRSILKGLTENTTLQEMTIEFNMLALLTEKQSIQFWALLGVHKLHIKKLAIVSVYFPRVCGKGEATALAKALADSSSNSLSVTLKYITFGLHELKTLERGLLENKVLSELVISDRKRPEYARFVRSEQSGNIELQLEGGIFSAGKRPLESKDDTEPSSKRGT